MAIIHADRQAQFSVFHVMFCVPYDVRFYLLDGLMGGTARGCILQKVTLVAVNNVTLVWSYKAATNTYTCTAMVHSYCRNIYSWTAVSEDSVFAVGRGPKKNGKLKK